MKKLLNGLSECEMKVSMISISVKNVRKVAIAAALTLFTAIPLSAREYQGGLLTHQVVHGNGQSQTASDIDIELPEFDGWVVSENLALHIAQDTVIDWGYITNQGDSGVELVDGQMWLATVSDDRIAFYHLSEKSAAHFAGANYNGYTILSVNYVKTEGSMTDDTRGEIVSDVEFWANTNAMDGSGPMRASGLSYLGKQVTRFGIANISNYSLDIELYDENNELIDRDGFTRTATNGDQLGQEISACEEMAEEMAEEIEDYSELFSYAVMLGYGGAGLGVGVAVGSLVGPEGAPLGGVVGGSVGAAAGIIATFGFQVTSWAAQETIVPMIVQVFENMCIDDALKEFNFENVDLITLTFETPSGDMMLTAECTNWELDLGSSEFVGEYDIDVVQGRGMVCTNWVFKTVYL